MTADEYIEAKIAVGHQLHIHDGVWWENTRWGYCKPAIPFEAVPTRNIRPAIVKSMVGFGHRCLDAEEASGFWDAMVMSEDAISSWSLAGSVGGKRRNLIRKGLRNNEIRKLVNLEPYRDELAAISISTAIRNKRGYPPAYYRERNEEWWESILRVARYSEFWGAFFENKLIAYLSIHVAGHRAVIDGAKSSTEFLHACPNDALVFSFIESCRERGGVREIWYGHFSEDKSSLNQFKSSFGFNSMRVPFRRMALGGLIRMPRLIGARIGAS